MRLRRGVHHRPGHECRLPQPEHAKLWRCPECGKWWLCEIKEWGHVWAAYHRKGPARRMQRSMGEL